MIPLKKENGSFKPGVQGLSWPQASAAPANFMQKGGGQCLRPVTPPTILHKESYNPTCLLKGGQLRFWPPPFLHKMCGGGT